jgi:hypothetical protein
VPQRYRRALYRGWYRTVEAIPQWNREAGPITRDPEVVLGAPVFGGTRLERRTLFDSRVDRGVHAFREFLADCPAMSRELAAWRNAGCGWSMRMPVATERTSAEKSSRRRPASRDCLDLASGPDAVHPARSFGKIPSIMAPGMAPGRSPKRSYTSPGDRTIFNCP